MFMLGKPGVDPKRSVPAKLLPSFGNGEFSPGDCYLPTGEDQKDRLYFACPGCAVMGSIGCGHPKPAQPPSWDIVKGTLSDPSTLSLLPSINCISCCGWHGYLTDGVFKSC